MNEEETRAEYIDPALAAAGWGVIEGSRIRRAYMITQGKLEGHGRRGKSLEADYVLFFRNTKLAVIEAKAWGKPLTEGVAQAKNYAEKLNVRFTYSTNGQGIYQIDMQTGVEQEIEHFPTPDELWHRIYAKEEAWRDRFAAVPLDEPGHFQNRYYQDIAVDRVLEAIVRGKDRVLLTLATGTGKTFIAFQIAWKLFHSRWNLKNWREGGEPSRRPRVLFLADRNILADQAYNAFSAFPEDALVRIAPDSIRKKRRVPTNGHLFFTIYQTFMTGYDEKGNAKPSFGDYPPDFFDFIVIDECHRGGAKDESAWRDILEYFAPAVQLGLTATPKRQHNADTYAYFGEPVYIYSLREGINDGFLTPFRVKQFSTTMDEYVYAPDDMVIEGEVDEGRVYQESEFNRDIEIIERERYRVRLFMQQINPQEKTIVFCVNQNHALLVRDLINQEKSIDNPDYCHRVTADEGALGDEHLRQFQDNERTIPTILTTSQKLSTGMDARNVRNIVLMRPIRSIIEFKQIIGRGTRLFDGKDYFTIYDFVKAHEHFNDPEWDGEPIKVERDPCAKCGRKPCECNADLPSPCQICGQIPCICEKAPCSECGESPCVCERETKVKIKLADNKERNIRYIEATTFWHSDGKPISAKQFIEKLFGELPEFFKDEDELRRIWSAPDTRAKLLKGLAEKGFGVEQMAEMQNLIGAERSDLFDVLMYIAYACPMLSRRQRADIAKTRVSLCFAAKQREFLNFVLGHYVDQGVQELEENKLPSLLEIKYKTISDALAELGALEEIKRVFDDFQKYLYQSDTSA